MLILLLNNRFTLSGKQEVFESGYLNISSNLAAAYSVNSEELSNYIHIYTYTHPYTFKERRQYIGTLIFYCCYNN